MVPRSKVKYLFLQQGLNWNGEKDAVISANLLLNYVINFQIITFYQGLRSFQLEILDP